MRCLSQPTLGKAFSYFNIIIKTPGFLYIQYLLVNYTVFLWCSGCLKVCQFVESLQAYFCVLLIWIYQSLRTSLFFGSGFPRLMFLLLFPDPESANIQRSCDLFYGEWYLESITWMLGMLIATTWSLLLIERDWKQYSILKISHDLTLVLPIQV